MANIQDYLKWRGDLTFKQAAFNEVDNLILAVMSYIVFDSIVPGPAYKDIITLEEASKLFFKMYTDRDLAVQNMFTKMVPFILRQVAETERFKNVGLCKYVSSIDYKDEKQFAALHILLEDGTTYISYRGTDDTLVGWKEDFNMTYMAPVPAQIEALKYLEETTKKSKRLLRLGGHSKGGNLAIYAGTHCNDQLKQRIIEIYNNDGPGFYRDVIESQGYKQMLHKIKTIIPESSVVGMLLEHEEEYVIVKSKKNGILQHDIMNWEVLGTKLIYLESVSKNSRKLDYTIKSWLENIDINQRAQFIEALYNVLASTGAKTVSELTADKLKNINMALKTWGTMEETTKEMVIETLKIMISEYYKLFLKG